MNRARSATVTFARISEIRVLGGSLVVTDRLMSPHLVVVDLASGRVVRHFGRSPGEFRDPVWMLPVDGAPSDGRRAPRGVACGTWRVA